jgi:hypothetical protein
MYERLRLEKQITTIARVYRDGSNQGWFADFLPLLKLTAQYMPVACVGRTLIPVSC